MLESLLNNFTLLTTVLFFGHMVTSKYFARRKRTPVIRVLIGFVLGLFGVVLMYYTFPIHANAVADFSQLPILISVYLGGGVAGIASTLIIALYRLLFLHGFSLYSLIAALTVPITLVIALIFLRYRRLSLKRWTAAVALSALITAIFLYILLGTNWLEPILIFTSMFMIGGLFTYTLLRHMRSTDDSLRMMQDAANRDFLTDLYNSRAFNAMMEQKVGCSNRDNLPFTILLIDIDHFKLINDNYGHPAGDAVLLQFADVLRETFRPKDRIIRKGGEEFVVIVDQCNEQQIVTIGERLRKNVEEHPFLLPNGTELKLTISAGSATYPGISADDLFNKADQALYRAKEAGRNRIYRAL